MSDGGNGEDGILVPLRPGCTEDVRRHDASCTFSALIDVAGPRVEDFMMALFRAHSHGVPDEAFCKIKRRRNGQRQLAFVWNPIDRRHR